MPPAILSVSVRVRLVLDITKLRPGLQAGLVPALVAAILASVIIYNRSLILVPHQSYIQVLSWQILAWLPWVGILMAVRRQLDRRSLSLSGWALVSFFVAFGSTGWFMGLSYVMSPYLGEPGTTFGLYRWFLIFWCFLSFLFFWAYIGFRLLRARLTAAAADAPTAISRQQVAIWHNGVQIIAPKDEIVWIGAKDYYAQIHLINGDDYWVRMRLSEMERELDSKQFVRVHRAAMINTSHLRKLERSGPHWEAVLAKGHRVRVSRSGRSKLEKHLNLIR